MRGHIRKRGAGYQIVVELGKDENGKRKQKAIGGFKKQKEAEKALAELIAKIEKGDYYEHKELLLSDYLNQWYNDYAKHNVSEVTLVFYKDIIDRILIPYIGKIQIAKLKPLQIQSFLSKILEGDISSTTARHYYNVLNIALNQAVKWQIIDVNPCNAVEPPKKEKRKLDVLTPFEVEKLLEYTKTCEFSVMYVPITLAIMAGLRRGEILGLEWSNFDSEKGLLRITNNMVKVGSEVKMTTPKTDKSVRTVALLPSTVELLKQHRIKQIENRLLLGDDYIKNNFVCTWPNGKTIRPDYITHTLKKLLKKCDLPDIRFHDLRHTHATLLLLQGVNPKIVSERLGHSKVDITLDTYSHVLPEMQKEAVEKLENLFIKNAK